MCLAYHLRLVAVDHHCERVYSLRLMIYSLWRDMLVKADDIQMYISPQASYTFDDMPLLSQWIKKTMENVSFSIVFLERMTGLEPATSTLARWRSTK